MGSSFPGMNPYLEHDGVFHGFHLQMVVEIGYHLAPQVRPAYIVDVGTRVYVDELPAAERRALVGRPGLPTVDVVEISYVKIMGRDDRRMVTVIEVLSPTNKLDPADREAYQAARDELIGSSVHLIEIDLLRAGAPMPLTTQPDSAYRVMLSRHERRPAVDLWPLRVRDCLPTIPVPLRAPDPDATLDLQACLDRVYDAAGYADYVYGMTPQPPLHPEDARWAEGLIGRGG